MPKSSTQLSGRDYWYACRDPNAGPADYFIFADELTAASDHVERLHWNAWLAYAQQPGHLTPAEVEDWLRHVAEHDHYETLFDQLKLVEGAGFRDVDCPWRTSTTRYSPAKPEAAARNLGSTRHAELVRRLRRTKRAGARSTLRATAGPATRVFESGQLGQR